MKAPIFLAAALALAGCGTTGSLPATASVPTDPKIAQAIAQACAQSGLFKAADGTLSTFIPAAALPVGLVNAGVDQVCANPAQFAADASTAEWVMRQLARAGK